MFFESSLETSFRVLFLTRRTEDHKEKTADCKRRYDMTINKIFQATVIICASLVFASCAVSKLDNSLDYRTGRYTPSKPFEGTLGVDEFIDLRPQGTTSDAKNG